MVNIEPSYSQQCTLIKKKYFRHADFFIYLKPISQQIYHIVSSTCTVCTKPRFCILEFVC